jgi:sugar phosphate permease
VTAKRKEESFLPPIKRPKVFYGWWIVTACTMLMFYVPGIVNQGFTAIFQPIAEDFGWSYAQVSIGASLRGLEVGLLAPLIGFLVDRWGSRRLVFGGVIIVALGLFSLSRVHSLGAFYWSFVLIAIGMSACVGTALLPTVTNWFRKRVGLAIGALGAGAGFGGFLVPVVTFLVDKYDWRTALSILSLSVLIVGLPLSLLIRHKPEKYGYLPDGALEIHPDVKIESAVAKNSSVPIITAKQVLKTRIFWQLGLASSFISIVTGAVMTHIMPYLSSVGISRTYSSTLVLIIALISVGGRLGSGWLGDRLNTKQVYIFFLILMTLGTVSFAYIIPGRLWALALFVIFYALGSAGNMTLRPVLLRKYFHSGKFGTILGIADAMMMLGQIGVPLAGWVYDTWGSYQGIWLVYAGVIIVGIILLITTPNSLTIQAPQTVKQETAIK